MFSRTGPHGCKSGSEGPFSSFPPSIWSYLQTLSAIPPGCWDQASWRWHLMLCATTCSPLGVTTDNWAGTEHTAVCPVKRAADEPVSCCPCRPQSKGNTFPRKGSGDTERVKGGGKDVWIQQQVGTEVAFTLGALLSGWMLTGSADCLPVCLLLKNASLENEATFW